MQESGIPTGVLDARYVNVSGDTMTGALTLANLTNALNSGDYPVYLYSGKLNEVSGNPAFVFDTVDWQDPTQMLFSVRQQGTEYFALGDGGQAYFTPYSGYNAIELTPTTSTGGINIVASSPNLFGVTTSITYDGTDLGTLAGCVFLSAVVNDSGYNNSRLITCTGSSPKFISLTSTAVNTSGGMLELTNNSNMNGLFRISSSAGLSNDTEGLIELNLTGTSTRKLAKYLNCNGGGAHKFSVDYNGNIFTNGAYISNNGTLGTYQNLLKFSEQLDNAAWTKTNVTITADYAASPFNDGSMADRIQDALGTPSTLSQTVAGTTASKTFTLSFWFKGNATNGSNIKYQINSGNETGTIITYNIASTAWRYFSTTQTFTSGSTGSPTVLFTTATSLDGCIYGVNLSETSYITGYTATADSAKGTYQYGSVVNGILSVGGANFASGIQLRQGGNQGSSNLFDVSDKAGTTLLALDSTGLNWVHDTTTGSQYGTASNQKIGWWGATPIVQPSAFTQTYSTATKTHAALTSATLTDSTGGTANTTVTAVTAVGGSGATTQQETDINDNFADLVAQINALRVDLENTKQVLNAVIDDGQAEGLLA